MTETKPQLPELKIYGIPLDCFMRMIQQTRSDHELQALTIIALQYGLIIEELNVPETNPNENDIIN